MIGNVIQSRYLEITDYPTAAALSFILMVDHPGDGARVRALRGHRVAHRRGRGRLMEAATVRAGASGAPSAVRMMGRRCSSLAERVRRARRSSTCSCRWRSSCSSRSTTRQSRFNFIWQGFTLKHWKDPFKFQDLTDALVTSIQVAALTTVVATLLGTLMALALVRYQFRGQGGHEPLHLHPAGHARGGAGRLAPVAVHLGRASRAGSSRILIAHVMFSVSFVVVTVRSRLIGFDRSIEEAAQDLGANGLQTFFRITLPLIAPAVLAAALLTFALSIDDFVITNFNAGIDRHLPALHLGRGAGVDPAAGERAGGDDLLVHRGDDVAHGVRSSVTRSAWRWSWRRTRSEGSHTIRPGKG